MVTIDKEQVLAHDGAAGAVANTFTPVEINSTSASILMQLKNDEGHKRAAYEAALGARVAAEASTAAAMGLQDVVTIPTQDGRLYFVPREAVAAQ